MTPYCLPTDPTQIVLQSHWNRGLLLLYLVSSQTSLPTLSWVRVSRWHKREKPHGNVNWREAICGNVSLAWPSLLIFKRSSNPGLDMKYSSLYIQQLIQKPYRCICPPPPPTAAKNPPHELSVCDLYSMLNFYLLNSHPVSCFLAFAHFIPSYWHALLPSHLTGSYFPLPTLHTCCFLQEAFHDPLYQISSLFLSAPIAYCLLPSWSFSLSIYLASLPGCSLQEGRNWFFRFTDICNLWQGAWLNTLGSHYLRRKESEGNWPEWAWWKCKILLTWVGSVNNQNNIYWPSPCARCASKHLICVNVFNSHKNHMK